MQGYSLSYDEDVKHYWRRKMCTKVLNDACNYENGNNNDICQANMPLKGIFELLIYINQLPHINRVLTISDS